MQLEPILGWQVEAGSVLPDGRNIAGNSLSHELDVGLGPSGAKAYRGDERVVDGAPICLLQPLKDREVEGRALAGGEAAINVQQKEPNAAGRVLCSPGVEQGL